MGVHIPFPASCGLVISAMCHPHQTRDDIDPHLRPVLWGVTDRAMYEGQKHCSPSLELATILKIGKKFL
jgi:hypothetical protein